MKKVLVTGATGFVGRHICDSLVSNGFVVTGTTRSSAKVLPHGGYGLQLIGEIGNNTDWSSALRDIDYIVHLAARVHIMSEVAENPLTEFRRVNTRGTEKLAEYAVVAGVKRLIYVSTIKVLGEKTDGLAFRDSDIAAPCDPYAVSKLEAEEALRCIADDKGLEIVILRPPLIYGSGVGGNFLRVLGLVSKGIPLPLGMIRNSRTMLAVSNLCDVIRICLEHPDAPGRTFLVADGEETSTPGLFKMIGELMDKPVRFFPVPEQFLKLGGKMLRRSNEVARLCDSLQVNIENTKGILHWSPQTSLEDGLRSVVNWYLREKQRTDD